MNLQMRSAENPKMTPDRNGEPKNEFAMRDTSGMRGSLQDPLIPDVAFRPHQDPAGILKGSSDS